MDTIARGLEGYVRRVVVGLRRWGAARWSLRNRHDLRWQRHKSACRYGVPHVYSVFVVVDRTVRCMNDDGFRTISRVRIQSSGRLGVYVHQLLPVWREQPLVIRAPCISVFGLLSRRRCFKTRPSLRGTWRDEQAVRFQQQVGRGPRRVLT